MLFEELRITLHFIYYSSVLYEISFVIFFINDFTFHLSKLQGYFTANVSKKLPTVVRDKKIPFPLHKYFRELKFC